MKARMVTKIKFKWVANPLLILAIFLSFVLPVSDSLAAQADNAEVIRLQGLLDNCLSHLQQLEKDPELARLEKNASDARSAWRNAKDLANRLEAELKQLEAEEKRLRADAKDERRYFGITSGGSDDGPALRLDRVIRERKEKRTLFRTAEESADQAEERADDAEKAVSMHQASRAMARRDTTSIKAQCKDLQTRLQAARLASKSDTVPPSQPDAWGIKEGRSWSGAASEPASNGVEERHVIDERSGIKPGTDDPRRDRPRDDPQRDRWRFDTTPNRTVLNVGAGPYHEFAALCRIGWASALSLYSVGRADDSIIDHLRFAGEHMEMANRTTFDPLRAWPDWQSRKSRLHDQANRLDRSDGSSRPSLSNELKMSWTGHANELAKQLIASRLEHLPTCDSHYARLGYQLCYGQQALQIAEVAERDGNRPLMQRSLGDARDRLQGARRELSELPRVKLATGSCVDLSPVANILQGGQSRDPLATQVRTANSAFEQAIAILGQAQSQTVSQSRPQSGIAGQWCYSMFLDQKDIDHPESLCRIQFDRNGDQFIGSIVPGTCGPDRVGKLLIRKHPREGETVLRLRAISSNKYEGQGLIWDGWASASVEIQGERARLVRWDSQTRDHRHLFRCEGSQQENRSSSTDVNVAVTAETSPDPRRVGQRYTFTLVLDNRGPNAIHVSSVGATTTINGRQAGSGKNYFGPQSHRGRGWLTSVAPPGRKTVIYRGTGTANADGLGLWKTALTFHTDQGDFTTHTSSRVIR